VEEDTTAFRTVEAQPRSGLRRAWQLSALLFVVAAGLVYYASQLWVRNETAHSALESTKSELADVRARTAERTRQLAALETHGKERDGLLEQNTAQLRELNTALAAAQTRLAELDEERSEIKEQLAEFEQLTRQFQRMIDSGRLEVTFRRGRMIVELPAQVLFPSGSADLTDEGNKSLGEVARILRSLRSRRFIVAGHTDNVPVGKNERFASNWELSSARAVKVTGELIRGGLRPEQLVAAGYSEYDPVARNTSEKGRQKNRRIEIILEPRLVALPGLEPDKSPGAAKK
jgi:chemotaxis protein MotB